MATTTTNPTIEKRVADAIRAAGGKVKELNDEQRGRAVVAPEVVPDMRGKALGTWVLQGEAESNGQGAPAEAPAQLTDEQRYEQLAKQEQGRTAKEQKEFEKLRTKLGKGGGTKVGGQPRKQYPTAIKVASARAKEVRGYGPGPKQHADMRKGLTKALGEEEVTPKSLLDLVGAKSVKELTQVAAKELPLSTATNLKALGKQMGDDVWCKGGHLAAAIVAWIDELTDSPDYRRLSEALTAKSS